MRSAHWPGRRPRWIVMRPKGVTKPRVVVSLHGKGGDALATFSALRLQDHIVETDLAVAAIDGGDYYWHARRSESTGADNISPDTPPCDTGAMVRKDFIPMLGGLGLDVTRVAFLGWSMGGYGALLLGETMGPSAVAAVAPMSAALWVEPGLSAAGAFDDREDWERNDVFARRSRFADIPIRLACGTSDPFYSSDKAFVDGFPSTAAYDVSAVFDPGGHDADFWASHGGGQMRFLAGHLT
jgi:poly(3-hydroxybutyrate) depolymerase